MIEYIIKFKHPYMSWAEPGTATILMKVQLNLVGLDHVKIFASNRMFRLYFDSWDDIHLFKILVNIEEILGKFKYVTAAEEIDTSKYKTLEEIWNR